MPCLLRGPHHLADEALRTLGALVAVADAAGPDMEFVVARRHGWPAPRNMAGDGARIVEIVDICGKSASKRDALDVPKISNPTNHMRPTDGGAFILPSVRPVPLLLISDTSKRCAKARHDRDRSPTDGSWRRAPAATVRRTGPVGLRREHGPILRCDVPVDAPRRVRIGRRLATSTGCCPDARANSGASVHGRARRAATTMASSAAAAADHRTETRRDRRASPAGSGRPVAE